MDNQSITQIPISFPFQSYFDGAAGSSLYEKALLAQPTNSLIVDSTRKPFQKPVYRVGSAGLSQTPIAIRAYGSKSETGVMILKPGQWINISGSSALEYGLPFGWLGGGISTLIVGHGENVDLDLGPARPELIFHRFRTVIEASAANLPALRRNWPLQFPWTRAVRGTASADQGGNPTIRIEPSRTLLRLRSQIAVDKVVGLVFRGSREFDEASDGTYALGNLTSTFNEIVFKASTDPSLALYPMASIPDDFLRLACDEGGLTMLGLGDAALTNVEVDVVRFGRI